MFSNWQNWFLGSARDRELAETRELYAQVRARERASPVSGENLGRFVVDIIFEVCEHRGVAPSLALGGALYGAIKGLLAADGFVAELDERPAFENLTIEEGVAMRENMRRHLRFLDDHERLLPLWRNKVVNVFAGTLAYFPQSAFTDYPEDEGVRDIFFHVVLHRNPCHLECLEHTARQLFVDRHHPVKRRSCTISVNTGIRTNFTQVQNDLHQNSFTSAKALLIATPRWKWL